MTDGHLTGPAAPPPPTRSHLGAGRIVALVAGSLLALLALGLVTGGGAMVAAYTFGRDADGYFTARIDQASSSSAAITAEDVELGLNPGSGWLADRLRADVRLTVTDTTGAAARGGAGGGGLFVAIAPQRDIDRYLAGVAHDEITSVVGGKPVYRHRTGTATADPPTSQGFWTVAASGPGTQRLTWRVESGDWGAVVMNSDGSASVNAEIQAGVKAPFILPLGLTLLAVGLVLGAVAAALIVYGVLAAAHHLPPSEPTGGPGPGGLAAGAAPVAGEHVLSGPVDAPELVPASPVRLDATLSPDLSRGLWLVKWLLAIPHYIVLLFLWAAFVVLTVVAGFAILFTGRYPESIFRFNLGVLRWYWRVSYYATTGGIGTDRYPPFSLGPEPDYPARLDIAYPERLSRGLVLVKWWLLAIPHYIVLGVLFGGTVGWIGTDRTNGGANTNGGPGLLPILVVVAGVVLLFTARYPRPLFNLIIGFNRWLFRVIAYSALMTDQYPPFRLDQGGPEPRPVMPPNPPLVPAAATATATATAGAAAPGGPVDPGGPAGPGETASLDRAERG